MILIQLRRPLLGNQKGPFPTQTMRQPISPKTLKHLLKENPSLKAKDIHAFETALSAFEHASQYPLLAPFRMNTFLAEKELANGLEELTFKEFAALGTAEILALEGLGKKRLKRLTELFTNLAEGSSEFITDGEFQRAEQVIPPGLSFPEEELSPLQNLSTIEDTKILSPAPNAQEERRKILSSVEAETLLTEAFNKLQLSERYPLIAEKRLTDLWPSGAVRAPFLESLTFRQLLGMKLQNILEKRTVTEQKIKTVVGIIHSFLEEDAKETQIHFEPELVQSESHERESHEQTATRQNVPPEFPWSNLELPAGLSTEKRELYQLRFDWFKLVWKEVASGIGGSREIAKLILEFPKYFSAMRFIEITERIEEFNNTGVFQRELQEELLLFGKDHAKESFQTMEIALRTPAISMRRLQDLLDRSTSKQFDTSTYDFWVRAFCYAFGAEQVRFGTRKLQETFSVYPELLEGMLGRETEESEARAKLIDMVAECDRGVLG